MLKDCVSHYCTVYEAIHDLVEQVVHCIHVKAVALTSGQFYMSLLLVCLARKTPLDRIKTNNVLRKINRLIVAPEMY